MSIIVDDLRDSAMPSLAHLAADEIEELEAAYASLFKKHGELQRDLAAAQEALYTAELDANLALERLKEAQEALKNHLHLDNHNAIVRQLQERAQRAEAQAEQNAKDAKEAIAIASFLFDAWEDGTPCFETDGESGMGASIGKAFKLSNEDFTRCTEFLNRVDPRGAAIDAARAK